MNKTRNIEIWLGTEWGILGYLKRGKNDGSIYS